eukprot:244470-Heterocapsa_arctica.AAC.1
MFPGIETTAKGSTSATTARTTIALNKEYCRHHQPNAIKAYPSTIWDRMRNCQMCGKRWRAPAS